MQTTFHFDRLNNQADSLYNSLWNYSANDNQDGLRKVSMSDYLQERLGKIYYQIKTLHRSSPQDFSSARNFEAKKIEKQLPGEVASETCDNMTAKSKVSLSTIMTGLACAALVISGAYLVPKAQQFFQQSSQETGGSRPNENLLDLHNPSVSNANNNNVDPSLISNGGTSISPTHINEWTLPFSNEVFYGASALGIAGLTIWLTTRKSTPNPKDNKTKDQDLSQPSENPQDPKTTPPIVLKNEGDPKLGQGKPKTKSRSDLSSSGQDKETTPQLVLKKGRTPKTKSRSDLTPSKEGQEEKFQRGVKSENEAPSNKLKRTLIRGFWPCTRSDGEGDSPTYNSTVLSEREDKIEYEGDYPNENLEQNQGKIAQVQEAENEDTSLLIADNQLEDVSVPTSDERDLLPSQGSLDKREKFGSLQKVRETQNSTLRDYKKHIKEKIIKDIRILNHLTQDDLNSCPEIINFALKCYDKINKAFMQSILKKLKTKNLIKLIRMQSKALNYVDSSFKNYQEIIKQASDICDYEVFCKFLFLDNNAVFSQHVSRKFKNDCNLIFRNIVFEIKDPGIIEDHFVEEYVKIIIDAVPACDSLQYFKQVSESAFRQKYPHQYYQIAFAYSQDDGLALEYVPHEFQKNHLDLIRIALGNNPEAIAHVTTQIDLENVEEFQEIIYEACMNDANIIDMIPDSIANSFRKVLASKLTHIFRSPDEISPQDSSAEDANAESEIKKDPSDQEFESNDEYDAQNAFLSKEETQGQSSEDIELCEFTEQDSDNEEVSTNNMEQAEKQEEATYDFTKYFNTLNVIMKNNDQAIAKIRQELE